MKTVKALLTASLGTLIVSSALAQTPALYWDPGATGPTTGGSSGGTGNWDTSSSLWYDGVANDGIWTNGDDAYFTNTAGTVTLQLNVTASDIYFTNVTGNYYITNATGAEQLTINNTVDTGGSEDTIAAVVNNSGTLNKNGAGRLHLPVSNNINNANVNQGELSFENNNSVSGNITVANGATLEFNGDGTNNLLNNVGNNITITGSGSSSNGAIGNVSGITEYYGQITLAGNSEIYVGTNAAFVYWGSDNDTPLTDNGNGYNLTIGGPVGNVQFADYGINISGSLIIEPGAACYMYLSGSVSNAYISSVVSTNATLFAQADNGLGSPPAKLMTTNIILDGGTLIGYGTWYMNGYRGITVTTNGGTISDTDTSSGSDWYTGNIYASNAPVSINSSGGTIRIGGATNNANLNLGMGTLTVNGGNIALSYLPTSVTPIYSNLVVNGCTFTVNYDVTSGQNSQFGTFPQSFAQSNIWLNGGQLHIGHSTSISPVRGIYVGPSGTTLDEVTSSGTVTWGSTISGPGNITFDAATHVLATNNTYTGNTTIDGSTILKVGNNGAYGTLGTGNTADNGSLYFNRTGSYTYGGVISGSGIVSNTASGVVTLTGKNTYTGATTITAGTLLLDGDNTGTGPVHVISGGALGGTGTISGSVGIASGGLLSLLTNTLTINNNLIVTGNVSVVVNKSFTQPNGEAVVNSSFIITNGAAPNANTLTITNVGPALAVGDKFTLFSQPVVNGGNMAVKVSGSTGYTLVNNLAVDGSISVTAVPPPPQPVINSVHISSGNFIFSGTNGSDNATYYVLSTTNLTIPVSQWTIVSTNTFLGNGQFSVTNPINPGTPQSFYLLQAQ